MAFLDNSGTIILDAILTDLGRKRMAEGRFKISRFALGDDEIDYSLADVENSDYSKLVTLTPIEALSADNAVINYGLQDHISDDIFYIPQIKVNELLEFSVKKHSSTSGDFYYLAVNDQTTKKLRSILGTSEYHLQNGDFIKNKLVFESGIEPPGAESGTGDRLLRDKISRERYILNYNLLDRYFIISCDNRFIDKLLIVDAARSHFENNKANDLFVNFDSLKEVVPVSLQKVLKYHSSFLSIGVDNMIFSYTRGVDNRHSAIKGPRGTICAINFKLNQEITVDSNGSSNFRFAKFGKTGEKLFDATNKFDYIDTTIYIQGLSSSARLQVPIRILRYEGT